MSKEQTRAQPVEPRQGWPSLALPHVAARLFDTPLAIERGKIRTIIAAMRPYLGIDLAGLPQAPVALAQWEYEEEDERENYDVVNGYGVIDVCGTLVYKASGLNAFSGLTSYEHLSADHAQALEDPAVETIAFRLHTFGGEVDGLFDFTDQIFAGRAKKKTIAIIDQKAFSAGYAIAAACSQIFIAQGGMTGSIGVVMERLDQTEANKQLGYKVEEIFAGDRKVDTDPDTKLTDAGRAALQATVDKFYDLFTSKVATYRGISQDMVKATQAGVFVGADAITQRLADKVSTLEAVIGGPMPEDEDEEEDELEEILQPGTPEQPYEVPDNEEEVNMKIDNIAALVKEYPDLTAKLTEQARVEAKAEGKKESTTADCETAVKAEQDRIKEILGLAGYALPKLVDEALFVNGGLNVDKAARVFLEKKYEKTEAAKAAFLEDAPAPVPISPLPMTQIDGVQASVNKQLGLDDQTFVKYRNGGVQPNNGQ